MWDRVNTLAFRRTLQYVFVAFSRSKYLELSEASKYCGRADMFWVLTLYLLYKRQKKLPALDGSNRQTRAWFCGRFCIKSQATCSARNLAL